MTAPTPQDAVSEPILITNDPCGCPADTCVYFVEPAEHCINRLSGEVCTRHCDRCHPGNPTAATWHQNGECLRCKQETST